MGSPIASAGNSDTRPQTADTRPTVEIGVTPTRAAIEQNGGAPIQLACESIVRAIDECVDRPVEYRVGPHGFATPPARALSTVQTALEWWRSNRPREYADAELLVCSSAVSWDHGGMAARIGGVPAVAMNGDWMYDEHHRRLAVHEVGHCLGMRHGEGRRWTTDGETVATPMASVTPDRTPLRFSGDAARSLRGYLGIDSVEQG